MSLFNRIRRRVTLKEGGDPHSWDLPSSYASSKPNGRQTVIPNPKTFANAFVPVNIEIATEKNPLLYPDVSHAAVHLALLECFRNLRLSASILHSDDVNGLPAYVANPTATTTSVENGPAPDSELQTAASVQPWDTLIRLAITRFEAWWSNIDRVLRHASGYTLRSSHKIPVQLTKDYLPPLDVLLVWYVFMLDTEAYRAAVVRLGPRIQQLCFPWPAIREVIRLADLKFELPKPAQTLFVTLSSQSADILTYLQHPPAYTPPDLLPFGIDLFAEVKKTDEFIDEAHRLLWVRAPSMKGSLERATVGYFDAQLSRVTRGELGGDVPFGIELVWRTHRLFPEQYDYFLQLTGRGRQPPKQALSQSATGASEESGSSSRSSSNPCECWTCERIRDDLDTFVHSAPADNDLSPTNSTGSSPPPSPTIPQLSALSSSQIRQIQDDLGFYKAVESARSSNKPLPTRPLTAAELEAEKTTKQRQDEAGYMPAVYEYFERMPDGSYQIRKQKYRATWTGYPAV